MSVDLSSIPTLKLPTGNVLAFLMCEPHASIQTRQVRATGNGNLTLGKPQRSQGNIEFYQANYFLSYILSNFSSNSGPTSSLFQVGTDMMAKLIFGTIYIDSPDFEIPDNFPPCTPHQHHCCVQTGYSVGNENSLVGNIWHSKGIRRLY